MEEEESVAPEASTAITWVVSAESAGDRPAPAAAATAAVGADDRQNIMTE